LPHWSEISTADSVGARFLPRIARMATLGLALLAALGAHPAAAQEAEDAAEGETLQRQRIYVVSHALEPELEAVAARAGSAARAALREVEAADWAAADQRFLGYDDAALQHITEARRLLDEGSQAYLDLQLDNAIELLGRAIEEFDASQSALEDESGLGQALLYLGASYIFNGRTRIGRRVFERLHRQMPHITPDPNEFPPEVVEQFERSAPRANDGAIHIMSDPTGAIAYVDFVPRGLTPITVTGLVPGEHTVRLTRPGATPYIEQPDVPRNGQSETQAFLMDAEGNEGMAEMVAGITGHELEEGDGAIRQVGELLQLDKIGVIRVSYGDSREQVKLEMVIFDVQSGRRVLRGEVQAPRALGQLEPVVHRAVKQGVENVLRPQVGEDDETIIGGGGEVVGGGGDENGDGEDTPLYKEWWLWAAVGGAVVLGVVLTAVMVAGGDSDLGQNPNGQIVIEFGAE
jgi:hypothetical protein